MGFSAACSPTRAIPSSAFHPPEHVILYPVTAGRTQWLWFQCREEESLLQRFLLSVVTEVVTALLNPARGRQTWPTSGFSHCAWSQCSQSQGLFSSRGCACPRGSPSLALLELSFKSVFIIRIVTMEEFFLLSILIYLKTTLTWKISEHFSIPSFIKYYT